MLQIDVFTLFPGYLDWLRESRPVRNVLEAGELELRMVDLREFGQGGYRQVDDAPYGGGAGMVIRVDVVVDALEQTYGCALERLRERRRVVALAPVGRQLTDGVATELAGDSALTLLCGRYEGFDQRVHDHLADDEVSIGRYVLAGGELAAMVVADALIRRLPGALGSAESAVEESFSEALGAAPEYPHYTRPPSYRGWPVPDVLVSGDHERVREWRVAQSRARAEHFDRRPE